MGVKFNFYDQLLQEACEDWRKALNSLKQKYGGLAAAQMNLVGNAIVACYARERCNDVILEPALRIADREFILDVAMKLHETALLLLEVKLHVKSLRVEETQADAVYGSGYYLFLRRKGIYVGALHLYTSGHPPPPPNKWTDTAYLPPQPRQALEQIEAAIGRLVDRLRIR